MAAKELNHIEPVCPVYGQCGGCCYQDIRYDDELKLKQRYVAGLLGDVVRDLSVIAPIIASPKHYSYRNRIDLKVVCTRDNRTLIGFSPGKRPPGDKHPFGLVAVDGCPIAEKEISDIIPELIGKGKALLPEKYRRGNLTVRTGEGQKVFYGGIGRRSLEMKEEDYFYTTINNKRIHYSLDTFFQANLSILPKLFSILGETGFQTPETVFFDLYGGVGLFGVALADFVKEVILIEESVPSVKAAEYNKAYNKLENFHIIEGKVEDHLPGIIGRVSQENCVGMIDPPRCGLSSKALKFFTELKSFNELLYLSCSPEALARDLKGFKDKGWDIKQVIPFDFFPRTPHVETLVFLEPKK